MNELLTLGTLETIEGKLILKLYHNHDLWKAISIGFLDKSLPIIEIYLK